MTPSERRSDRVSLTILLEAFGRDVHSQEFKDPARTLLVSLTGAVIVIDRELAPGQQIQIRRRAPNESHRESAVRVINQTGRQKDGRLYGVEILAPELDLWGVEFPPLAETCAAIAKMLLECTYCRTREVSYLNEMELRAFEVNRGIARHCKTCSVPSIWTQVPHEDEKRLGLGTARGRRTMDAQDSIPSEGEQRQCKRMGLQTRLTACIRQQGEDDELAVCEDISPIGMCFRSKRGYSADTSIHVAVPYSPDAANIFLPARIVYSEQISKAGLFRHGTEYSQATPRTK